VARKTRADAVMAIVPSWIERHCVVPDGFLTGRPFRLYEWQLSYVAAFYTVRGSVEFDPVRPILGPAFRYQRGLIVGPQKLGKDPLGAAHMCVEAVGPVLFAGWAGRDDGYACADHGCRCGWEYAYDPGEPMGMSWPTPLIQITAVSEDQTDNAYDALRPMIDLGPLHDLIPKTGEQFIRLPNGGRIEPVTSSAPSRLGQRITFAKQGEAGLYTKRNGMEKVADTQYRNLAGMGGRASLDSNAWDPAEKSVAQREYEAKAVDIYRQFAQPPAHLSYANKAERRKIHRAVYPAETRRENGGHIDLDGIESEAAKMAEHDEAQAARFFGNRLVAGAGKAFDLDRWIDQLAVKRPKVVPDGALVTLGFDGSRRLDHTALIGTEVASGYQWPLGIWRADEHHGEIPAALINDVVDAGFETWDVWRLYGDPPYWEDTIAGWAGKYGKERVQEWWTNRRRTMAYAVRSWHGSQLARDVSHCATSDPWCSLFTEHVGNAVREETGYRDDEGTLWLVTKDAPNSRAKIDSVPAAVLSWEARTDAITAGALSLGSQTSVYETRGVEVFG
jgi:hypothetical protein